MLNSSDFMELESQRLTLEEIIEALMQDQIDLIEICGMRGIGKTTMLKEVVKRVKEENLFDEVCLLDVLVDLDPQVIQQRVVDNFDKANMRKDRKILVVLDNIGVKFNVQQLKTPWGCSHRTFKILYTSRIQGIWHYVPYKKEIALGLLSDDDAFKLFTFKAEFLVDTPCLLLPLAKEIVNVCGGLPHLLVTIREMVRDGRDWPTTEDSLEVIKCTLEDMLESLNSRITNPFPSMSLLDVQTASRNYLKINEKTKGLFLLCCLFEREKSIRVEDLARCALGLQLALGLRFFYGNDEVREQVSTRVDYLKKNYFLRDGKDHEHVAVPALVRTIGIFVPSFHLGCLVRHGAVFEWRDKNHFSYIWVISREITELPAGLIGIGDKLKIKFLLLECSNLKNLDLREDWGPLVLFLNDFNGTLTLPSSSDLQMLSLEYCLGDVCKNLSGLGKSYNLRILSFRGSGIEELPEEIGNLQVLQLLDLRETFALNRIPPNVISCLVELEELYLMDSNFVDWEGVCEEEGRNANLKEFMYLRRLKTLQIYVRTDVLVPEVGVFKRFKINRVIS